MLDEIKIAELLNAKLCHDLAGPIGAINNGIEFLEEENADLLEKSKELLHISAEQALIRLQFYRKLYGYISDGYGEFGSFCDLIERFMQQHNVTVSWDVNVSDIQNRLAKLISNLIFVGYSFIIKEGNITVSIDRSEGNKFNIKIEVISNSLKISREYLHILSGAPDVYDANSKNVQVYYTLKLLSEIKGKLTYTEDNSGKFIFSLMISV